MRRRFTVRQFNSPVFVQGYKDQQRHQHKLNQVLLEGDKDIVGREVLVVREASETTRIPFLFLREHSFTFDPEESAVVGHHQNQISGYKTFPAGGDSSKAAGARGEIGVREYSSITEYQDDSWFQNWVLPTFTKTEYYSCKNGEAGIRGKILDNKRTLLANLERNGRKGNTVIGNIRDEDLKYRPISPPDCKDDIPVFFLINDVSSSMGAEETELSRAAFSYAVRFLNSRYPEANLIYIVHDVGAREVDSKDFFSVTRCGGTKCWPAYRLMLNILNERYKEDLYVFFGIHVSDGNTRLSDALKCRILLKEITQITSRFAYFEVATGDACTGGKLQDALVPLAGRNFIAETASTRKEIVSCLGRFFSRQSGL